MSARTVHIVTASDSGEWTTYAPVSFCKRDTDSLARVLFLTNHDAAMMARESTRAQYPAVTFCKACVAYAASWDEAYTSLYGADYADRTPSLGCTMMSKGI